MRIRLLATALLCFATLETTSGVVSSGTEPVPAAAPRLALIDQKGGGAFVERLPHPEHVVVLNKPPGFSLQAALGVAREA